MKKYFGGFFMAERRGSVQVSTENIFPVIRQWLYTDRDIFLREIVSNAADAITKLERIRSLGEWKTDEEPEYEIHVNYDSSANTISVTDNGIGMTEEEVEEYINQIAYSGAMAFVEKYQDKGDAAGGVIGHFGLGFYSSFMVSEKVSIDTLSWQEDAKAVYWESEEGTQYLMRDSERTTRGTTITMYLNDQAKEDLNAFVLRETLRKYCQFMPYPIYFHDLVQEADEQKKNEELPEEERKEIAPAKEINDTNPLWLKNPKDITDEEYKAFYHKSFQDYRDPLFWIHLNMDYPMRLHGILYFPQADEKIETLDGRIKLYYNQVFVADDVREFIPDFLFLLRGCIDSPDLPLNVSRSALQSDQNLNKLSQHIVRKVADKLVSLQKSERESYEKSWDDLSIFVRYGSLRDEKFFERVKDAALFKLYAGGYKNLQELNESEEEKKIYYTSDQKKQVAYNERFKAKDIDVIIMEHEFDLPFMQMVQAKEGKYKFLRVDAEVEGEEGNESRKEQLSKIFKDATSNDNLAIEVRSLGVDGDIAILTEDEQARSMLDMRKMFERMEGKTASELDEMFPIKQTLILNTDASLVTKLCLLDETSGKEDMTKSLALEIYDLARLSHGSLESEDLLRFLTRSHKLLEEIEK